MNNKYIIKSTSHIIISNEIKRITKDIDNVSYFSMNDTELDDIIVDASYFGFLDTAKAIVITDFTYFGDKFKHEDESNKIIEFLKNYVKNTKAYSLEGQNCTWQIEQQDKH